MSGGAVIRGRVVRLADDLNTDVILPGQYLNVTEPDALGAHLLEGYDPELGAAIAPGDVLLGGRNFGAGSSREQAIVAILARGVQAVIAASFARIFLRNALNLALPAFECPGAWAGLSHGDAVTIDQDAATVAGPGAGTWDYPRQPPFVRELVERGGLVAWTRARLGSRDA